MSAAYSIAFEMNDARDDSIGIDSFSEKSIRLWNAIFLENQLGQKNYLQINMSSTVIFRLIRIFN